MDIKKTFLLISGVSLIVFGYYNFGVPPEAPLEEVLSRVKQGVTAVSLGGACVVISMLQKT